MTNEHMFCQLQSTLTWLLYISDKNLKFQITMIRKVENNGVFFNKIIKFYFLIKIINMIDL